MKSQNLLFHSLVKSLIHTYRLQGNLSRQTKPKTSLLVHMCCGLDGSILYSQGYSFALPFGSDIPKRLSLFTDMKLVHVSIRNFQQTERGELKASMLFIYAYRMGANIIHFPSAILLSKDWSCGHSWLKKMPRGVLLKRRERDIIEQLFLTVIFVDYFLNPTFIVNVSVLFWSRCHCQISYTRILWYTAQTSYDYHNIPLVAQMANCGEKSYHSSYQCPQILELLAQQESIQFYYH